MDRTEPVTLPFLGARDYITGVQLARAAQAACPPDPGTGLVVNCYGMLRQPALERRVSDAALSPKDWAAIMQIVSGGAMRFVGFRAAATAADGLPDRGPDPDAALAEYVSVQGDGDVVLRNPGAAGDFLTGMVLAIKTACEHSFAERGGKWIFAAARLPVWPDRWTQARATTRAGADAKVFQWMVDIDGSAAGSISFFNFASED